MRATSAEAPCEISRPVLEQAPQSSRALNCCRCVSRSPVACPTLDFPESVKNCHNINDLPQKVFSVLFPGCSSSPVIGAPKKAYLQSSLPSPSGKGELPLKKLLVEVKQTHSPEYISIVEQLLEYAKSFAGQGITHSELKVCLVFSQWGGEEISETGSFFVF